MSIVPFGEANHCCDQLLQSLESKVNFPTSTEYILTEETYWSSQEGGLAPACVVIPSSVEDISTSVSILTESNCQFAVKGGGHAPASGFAKHPVTSTLVYAKKAKLTHGNSLSIQDGVTIDLSQLKTVSVSAEGLVASIGGGATWIDVYLYLESQGLAVAGGRNAAVGVGGLILGGGISYFGPRVGWACDNVVNFQVVLASGEVVNANSTSNPDLWRALKGGATNFGIVTRFDLATFAQGEIWGGIVIQSITALEDAFTAFVNITTSPNYDPFASLVTSLNFNSTTQEWAIIQIPDYTKPVDSPSVFEDLLAIQPQIQSTVRIGNVSDLVSEGATLPGAPQQYQLFYTITIGPDIDLLNCIFNVANITIYEFFPDSVDNLSWGFTFEPLPTIITQYGDLKGGNSLGTTPKIGNSIIMLHGPTWTDSAISSSVTRVADIIAEKIQNVAKERGLHHEFEYLNYAHPAQHPLESYGSENFQRLKEVSRKFDPEGIFQKVVPGGFKLGL